MTFTRVKSRCLSVLCMYSLKNAVQLNSRGGGGGGGGRGAGGGGVPWEGLSRSSLAVRR